MKGQAIIILSISIIGLTGCSTHQNQQNMQKKLESIKKQPAPKIKALRLFPTTLKTAVYQATALRDPFQPFNTLISNTGVQPEPIYKNHGLTAYAINSLKMVGTIKNNKQFWALILTPDKTVYSITVGQRIGGNYGKITMITNHEIKFIENKWINNQWQQEESQLLLTTNKE